MMKCCIISLLLQAIICQGAIGQDTTGSAKKKSFIITISGFDNAETKGYLTYISDTSTGLYKGVKMPRDARKIRFQFADIYYKNISAISAKRKNSGGRGALIGGISGLIIGVAAGFIDGDDPYVPAEQDYFGFGNMVRMSAGAKAVAGGIAGGALGAGIGAIAGALIKKTFVIEGKKEKFDAMRLNMLDKVYGHN